MPFGLKNVRATYQRLVDKAFQKQNGRNLEVFVDYLVIKSRTEHEIIRDMEETFKTLREINMKLNPKKCTFGIEEGMFLGYKVNTKGIKQLIAELQTLIAPMEKEELIVYLAVAREAVSAVLMTEREAKQMPVYFVTRALQGPKINYTSMEKLVLALVHANDSPDTSMEAKEELLDPWTLFTDGSSCVDGFGVGLILTDPEGAEFTYALIFKFDATNNEAEYEALIAGLRIAEQIGHARRNKIRGSKGNTDKMLLTYDARRCKKTDPGMSGLPAGPFPEGPGKVKFLIVAMDYFTKWIRAKPVAIIMDTTHSKIGVKNYVFSSVLLPSNTHKPMAWWKEQTEG
ncbi:reverse transcriptase domain-containing protein [Tanacetum coccineum]